MKAIFSSSLHTDSWSALVSPPSITSAATSSMYRSPSPPRKSVSVATRNLCATANDARPFYFRPQLPLFFLLLLFFPFLLPRAQMNPIMLQCAMLFGVHKFQHLLRDEKLNATVQMSSCPLRGIAMYTQLVVAFNCDIYGMRGEQRLCSLRCSFPEDSFFYSFFSPTLLFFLLLLPSHSSSHTQMRSQSSINCDYNW